MADHRPTLEDAGAAKEAARAPATGVTATKATAATVTEAPAGPTAALKIPPTVSPKPTQKRPGLFTRVWACITNSAWWCRTWAWILDLAYLIWVLRVPVFVLLAGLALMSLAPQAQDLLVDLAPDSARVLSFQLLLIGWVAVTIYASFLLLGTDRRVIDYALFLKMTDPPRFESLQRMRRRMPPILGALPFVIVFVAAVRSYLNLPEIDDAYVLGAVKSALWWFAFWTVLLIAVFVFSHLIAHELLHLAMRFGDWVAEGIQRFLWLVAGRRRRLRRRVTFVVKVAQADPTKRRVRHFIGPLLLIVVFLVSASIFMFGANTAGGWLPRALIVPVILGGWLPLLTWLSGHGRRLRAPLITGGLLGLGLISALLGDNHSVRRIVTADFAKPMQGAAQPVHPAMTLNDALDLWMEENKCKDTPTNCPRPIIVAGAGGASRAGFFTASIIGYMMDGPVSAVASSPLAASDVRKRIFAISGVSGSSMGAVMTVTAMARAGVASAQPCTNRNPPLWYGGGVNNWRDCLEALTAGDFLTPVMLGLIFNDRLSFSSWPDRAAILEQAWEDRFAEVTGAANDDTWRDACPGDLRCAFMTLRPTKDLWLPLLVINGSSVATGRRIVTSILDPNYTADDCPTRAPIQVTASTKERAVTQQAQVSDVKRGGCLLFLESNSFHNLIGSSREPGWWTRFQVWLQGFDPSRVQNDVRLSTAALNSARFPIISPPGAVRNQQNQVIDRIVDGGYIDNYGALTALELAQAIHAIKPDLAPFVLALSNDPDDDPDLNPLDAPDGAFLADVLVPIEATFSVRSGHGRLAMGQVEAVLDHLAGAACGAQTAHVRVWPQFASTDRDRKVSRPVSMSWWLSTPIQIHLHQQTEPRQSVNQNGEELAKIWAALGKPAGCTGRPVVPSTAETQRRIRGE